MAEHDLVFCREDGTPLDRWQVRKKSQKITNAARLGGAWTPRELRHWFVSIQFCAHDVRLEDISDSVGHSSTAVDSSALMTFLIGRTASAGLTRRATGTRSPAA